MDNLQNITTHTNEINQNKSLHKLLTELMDRGNAILQLFLEERKYSTIISLAQSLESINNIVSNESLQNRKNDSTKFIKEIEQQQHSDFSDQFLESLINRIDSRNKTTNNKQPKPKNKKRYY